METAVYFAHYQMPVAVAVMLVVSVLIFFTAKYYDKKEGHVVVVQSAVDVSAPEEDRAPTLYALLPIFPVVLVLVFSPLVIDSIKIDVVTAMIIGTLTAFICELIVKRDFLACCKGVGVL